MRINGPSDEPFCLCSVWALVETIGRPYGEKASGTGAATGIYRSGATNGVGSVVVLYVQGPAEQQRKCAALCPPNHLRTHLERAAMGVQLGRQMTQETAPKTARGWNCVGKR